MDTQSNGSTTNGSRKPPAFEEARNRRQRARAVGLDPDYWYPVAYGKDVPVGKVVEAVFWKQSIAVFRGDDGRLRAIENRCAHRQLKLSTGAVEGCRVVCPYHGWTYDGDGKLASIPHDMFGRDMPNIQLLSFPVKERYGLVWVFPGDKALAGTRRIPDLPEIEAEPSQRWAWQAVDFTMRAHHSMIIENICDFTHGWLHRRYRPFSIDAKLTRCEPAGDVVKVAYDTKVGQGRITSLFVDRDNTNTDAMSLAYEYPYQWSNTGGRIKSWCFPLPIDEHTTRAFFIFLFDHFKVPFVPLHVPRRLMTGILRVANELHIKPLLRQDNFAVEEEQRGYEAHFDAAHAELNPVVNAFQSLNIRKWEEHLAKKRGGAASPSLQVAR